MESITIKALQELFENKSKYLVNTEKGHIGIPDNDDYEGKSGEFNETLKFYKHPEFPEGFFMRESWVTDSYADNSHLDKVTFVQGREKTITVYEPIN